MRADHLDGTRMISMPTFRELHITTGDPRMLLGVETTVEIEMEHVDQYHILSRDQLIQMAHELLAVAELIGEVERDNGVIHLDI